MMDIIKRNPCNSASANFEMAEMLLFGDPLATWREYKRGDTESVSVGEEETRGETSDTFESTMRRFFTHHSPKGVNCTRIQKQYMRSMLKKPRAVNIHTFVLRVKQLNRYLPFFPGPDNDVLDEPPLIEVVIGVCPMKWKAELIKENYGVGLHTLDQVETPLQMLEVGEALERASFGQKLRNLEKFE